MKQAKVLTPEELKRLLKIVTFTRHKDRNRLIVLFSFLAGLRACELAQLRIKDVMSVQTDIVEIKDTIYLQNWQTKGSQAQQVVVNEQLRKEIASYVDRHPYLLDDIGGKLFRSQKRNGFSSQTIQNLFKFLYREANIEG